MATAEQLRGLILSANELTEMTDWPDRLIEDYLTIDENFVIVAAAADSSDPQTTINTANISTNTSNISTNSAFISANKQSYTATYSANVYTVTPEINTTVWPALQAGLIIEFDLSTTANTSTVDIDFDGTVDELKWINDDSLASGDLDGDYTKRIRCRFNGTDWLIISDVSGSNADGEWERRSNGSQICSKIETISITHTAVTGSLFWEGSYQSADDFPKTFSSIPAATINTTGNATSVGWILCGNTLTTTDAWSSWAIISSISSSSIDFKISFRAQGRWY